MKKFGLLAFCIGTLWASDTKEQRIDAVFSQSFSGAVLIADASGVVFEKGYDMANREWNMPNSTEAVFRMGSITKQFTAMIVMQLVEKKKLHLDAKISDLLPWYRADTGTQVTIHHLLNHTSGIDSSGVKKLIAEHGCDTMSLKEEVMTFCMGDLLTEPGAQFAYNNAAYLTLGAIIEEVTGKTFEEALHAHILDPLGMTHSGIDNAKTIIPNRAMGYDRDEHGQVTNTPFFEMTLAASGGGLISTLRDMFLWDRALYTEDLLTDEFKKIMFTPASAVGNACGWFVERLEVGDRSMTMQYHPGQGNGFNSLIIRVPEDRVLILMVCNLGKPAYGTLYPKLIEIMCAR